MDEQKMKDMLERYAKITHVVQPAGNVTAEWYKEQSPAEIDMLHVIAGLLAQIDYKVDLRILTATIVLNDGPDVVYLDTDLPESAYPFEGNLSITFRATKNTGVEYVRKHFGIDAKVVGRVEDDYKFSKS